MLQTCLIVCLTHRHLLLSFSYKKSMLSSILPLSNAQLLKTISYISVQSIFRLFITITFFSFKVLHDPVPLFAFQLSSLHSSCTEPEGLKTCLRLMPLQRCPLCLRTLSCLTYSRTSSLGRFIVGPPAAKRCQMTLLCSKDTDQCL